eukprot:scaffold2.g7519.t1
MTVAAAAAGGHNRLRMRSDVPPARPTAARAHKAAARPNASGTSSDASGAAPPALQRRAALAAALAVGACLHASPAAAAVPTAAEALIKEFASSEGFRFAYPDGWVVAFDRSGSNGSGAVCVVGQFSGEPVSVAVFRQAELPEGGGALPAALDEPTGRALAVDPVQQQESTMRFRTLASRMARGTYEFEFVVETCRGEILESAGGKLLCLGAFGQDLQTTTRHIVGRAALRGGVAYMISASTPEARFQELRPTLTAVIDSFSIAEES